MSWSQVTVVAQQRISLGTGSERGFLTQSHPYVPGSVLRGALAAAWITERGIPAPGDGFRELFDGNVRFGPLFATGSRVQPLSVVSCKYPRPECRASTRDRAFLPDGPVDCPVCGVADTARGGVVGVRTESHTSTAIDPATGSAKEGQLFSRESLPPGTTLSGLITCAPEQLPSAAVLRFGGRRSVLGQISLNIAAAPAPAAARTGRAAVTLTSPAVLVDDYGAPTTDLAAALRHQGLTVLDTFTRSTSAGTGGWHAASGLPKPTELALVAGSTAVLDVSDADRPQLDVLLREGLGLRRSEGFGWIDVREQAWQEPRTALAPASTNAVRDLPLLPRDLTDWLIDRLRETGPGATVAAAALAEARVRDVDASTLAVLRTELERPAAERLARADIMEYRRGAA